MEWRDGPGKAIPDAGIQAKHQPARAQRIRTYDIMLYSGICTEPLRPVFLVVTSDEAIHIKAPNNGRYTTVIL